MRVTGISRRCRRNASCLRLRGAWKPLGDARHDLAKVIGRTCRTRTSQPVEDVGAHLHIYIDAETTSADNADGGVIVKLPGFLLEICKMTRLKPFLRRAFLCGKK